MEATNTTQPKKKWDMPGMYLKFMYFFLVFTQSLKPYTFFLPWSLFLYRKPSNFHRILPGPWPFESPTHPPWSQGFAPEKSTIISDVFLKKSTVFGAIGVPWTWKNKTGVRYIIYTLEVVATVKKKVPKWDDDFQPYSKYGETRGSQPIKHGETGWTSRVYIHRF